MIFPIFYTKEVLGKDEETFTLYKFRSMEVNADEKFEEVVESNGLDELGKPKEDPRITTFGKFMRRYFLDEIPQFYNLSRGDMSLVGIRPRTESEWDVYPDEHRKHALQYKPGLIGVDYSKSEDLETFEDHVEIEEEYLERKDEKPIGTDLTYFCEIFKNIVFDGQRSK
ncbi:MAG: sugar transferase [Candidatus Aenigmatarchaeota archaeon]